ncbi:MAG: carbohydrate-binding protein [Hydrogenophaga sp.]|nr:carbohydrate-binding protein [Hydrogenophaga sp.]
MAKGLLRSRWTWVPEPLEQLLDPAQGPTQEPVRAEIFGLAGFEQHGHQLAGQHRSGPASWRQKPFVPRVAPNARVLRRSLHYIAGQAHSGQPVSAAADALFIEFQRVEDSLRDLQEHMGPRFYAGLPVLRDAPLAGLPRVYSLAWAFLAHTDAAFDESLLTRFLDAYQAQHELDQRELWALPLSLRAVLLENLRRLADRIAAGWAARELATLCAHRVNTLALEDLQSLHATAAQRGVAAVFLMQLAHDLAGALSAPSADTVDEPPAAVQVLQWIQRETPDLIALQGQQHADDAADHLSMVNALQALRQLDITDWSDLLDRNSVVMRLMLADPLFAAEDGPTRNATLRHIEHLSTRSGRSGAAVARALLARMADGSGEPTPAAHWLDGQGRMALETELGMQPMLSRASGIWRRARAPATHALLIGTALAITAVLLGAWLGTASPAESSSLPGWLAVLAGLLAVWPASQVAAAVVDAVARETAAAPVLPRLALADGIPPEARVLVVVPAAGDDAQALGQAIHRLHLQYLANREPAAQFALLVAWNETTGPALLSQATPRLQSLNQQHPVAPGEPLRFVLLQEEPNEGTAHAVDGGCPPARLAPLLAALAAGGGHAYRDLGPLSALAGGTRYLLPLLDGWQLPPGALRALVAVAAHPLNQPRLDSAGLRVVQGHAALQPVGHRALPDRQPARPWWQRLADTASPAEDRAGFTGSGLLHVDAMQAVLGARPSGDPVQRQHPLAGALARCASVPDVALFHADATGPALGPLTAPATWEALPLAWQPQRWPLSPLQRAGLLDAARARLVGPASLMLLAWALLDPRLSLAATLLLVAAAHAAGPLVSALVQAVPRHAHLMGRRQARAAGAGLLRAAAAALSGIWRLPQDALRTAHAMWRGLGRDLAPPAAWPAWLVRQRSAPVVALGLGLALWLLHGLPPAPLAAGLLLLWAAAPLLRWLGRRAASPSEDDAQSPPDREMLTSVARDSWRLFERCGEGEHHHLPPDDLQTAPFWREAHHSSPQGIGLYLLSTACARQFGWIGTEELLSRVEGTLATVARLERHQGHLLARYHSDTLEPALPRRVDTAQSGHFSAYGLAVAQACRELARNPFDDEAGAQALRTSRERLEPRLPLLHTVLRRRADRTAVGQLLAQAAPGADDPAAFAAFQELLQRALDELQAAAPPERAEPSSGDNGREELHSLLRDHLHTLRSALQDAWSRRSGEAPHATTRLRALARQLEDLAWKADFRLLYHPGHARLHTGYRVDEQQPEPHFYELLASEARSASLLGLARGDLPAHHWRSLGRPFFASGARAALRSWSGSLADYLAPWLLAPAPHGSALHEASHSALAEHIAHTRPDQLPWGMAESAWAGRDPAQPFPVAPHGVPRLALRSIPPDERVIAPYASALAALLDPAAACANLRALTLLGARGRFGFFDALDCTPGRQARGGDATVVHGLRARDQGLSIAALTSVLHGGIVQRWASAHPALQAMAPLLHETAPRHLPPLQDVPRRPLPALQQRQADAARPVVPGASSLEPTLLLTNGRYSTRLRANGAGSSLWGDTALTRDADDLLRDDLGHFLYLRQDSSGLPVSLSSHPAPDPNAAYSASFHRERMVLQAQWPELSAQTAVWISPEDDIEFRRVTLSNHSDQAMDLEVVSAMDVALEASGADQRFPPPARPRLRSDWMPEQRALRFQPPQAPPDASVPRMAHFVADVQGRLLELRCQTDRGQWLGRHHSPARPRAGLDPVPEGPASFVNGVDSVAVLGVRLRLRPGAQASVTFATAASDDPDTLLALLDKYRRHSHVERASLMAATMAGQPATGLQARSELLPALQALTTALVATVPRTHLFAGAGAAAVEPADPLELLPLGLGGERPLLLVLASWPQGLPVLRQLAQAHRDWLHAGVAHDLVVLLDPEGAAQLPLVAAELAAGSAPPPATPQPLMPQGQATGGALHLLPMDALSVRQVTTLRRLARIGLTADGHPLAEQVAQWTAQLDQAGDHSRPGIAVPLQRSDMAPAVPAAAFDRETGALGFDTGSGLVPHLPWPNRLTGPELGASVSDSGMGTSWVGRPEPLALGAWTRDPVGDRPALSFLLQDRRTQAVWSLTPGAWADPHAVHHVEHGTGVSRISHRRGMLDVALSWCVDPDTAVLQVTLRLVNHAPHKAHLRLTGLMEWVLGASRQDRATLDSQPWRGDAPGGPLQGLLCTQTASPGASGGTAFFCMPPAPQAPRTGAAATDQVPDDSLVDDAPPPGTDTLESRADDPRASEPDDWTSDRAAFFDRQGQFVLPRRLGQRSGPGLDPCAAISRIFTLRPGAAQEHSFLIGHATTAPAARQLATAALETAAATREQRATEAAQAQVQGIQVATQDPLFDVLMNRWLPHQLGSHLLWAAEPASPPERLQAAMALGWTQPAALRAELLRFAAGLADTPAEAPASGVAAPAGAPDPRWLPVAARHYLNLTGDGSLLDEPVRGRAPGPAASLLAWVGRVLDEALASRSAHAVKEGDQGRPGLREPAQWWAAVAQARGDHEAATRWADGAPRLAPEVLPAVPTLGAVYRTSPFQRELATDPAGRPAAHPAAVYRATVECLLGIEWTHEGVRFQPRLPPHWPGVELWLTRDGRTRQFLLMRTTPEAVGATRLDAHTGVLQARELLRWTQHPTLDRFLVPLLRDL